MHGIQNHHDKWLYMYTYM